MIFFGLAALTPIVVRDAYFLDSLVLILLWGALSAAWNVAGGYAGQVSLGHSVFFGLGAYSAALLGTAWKEIFYFILFILVLVFRPAGLFGQRGAETLGV